MSKIEFTDKVALNENASIPDVNKCKASDMNEIKQVVNENDDKVGELDNLTTPNKDSVVGALNSLVIDSGSNSNGSWIKYSDGTLICTQKQQFTNVAVNNQWGSLYSARLQDMPDYPQEFIEEPAVSISLVTGESNKYSGFISGAEGSADSKPSTAKNVGTLSIIRGTSSPSATFNVRIIAIGKWK